MQIIEREIIQGTHQWLSIRRGCPTASQFDRIVTGSTRKPSSQRRTHMHMLVAQAFGESSGHSSKEMERGLEIETNARAAYELDHVCDVEQVGFVWGDERKVFGCSPDGLIGDDGGIEIKVPNLSTHIGYLESAKVPSKYLGQVYGFLFVTGRQWIDFYSHSYDPRLPPLTVRIQASDDNFLAWSAVFSNELPRFLDDLDVLRDLCGLPPLAERSDERVDTGSAQMIDGEVVSYF